MNIKKYIKTKIGSIYSSCKKIVKGTGQEAQESQEMLKLLFSILNKKKPLTEEEKTFIKDQAGDIIKMVVSGGVLALPGGVPIYVVLQKLSEKVGVDMVPSSFKEEKENYSNLKM
jgi:hypothetical protein